MKRSVRVPVGQFRLVNHECGIRESCPAIICHHSRDVVRVKVRENKDVHLIGSDAGGPKILLEHARQRSEEFATTSIDEGKSIPASHKVGVYCNRKMLSTWQECCISKLHGNVGVRIWHYLQRKRRDTIAHGRDLDGTNPPPYDTWHLLKTIHLTRRCRMVGRDGRERLKQR